MLSDNLRSPSGGPSSLEGSPLLQVKHATWIDRGRQVAALSCYLVIAVLSSVPGELRPHVPFFSDKLEHFVAFLILGAATVLSSPRAFSGRRLYRGRSGICRCSRIEGEFFIPGRVASLLDLAASSAGALVGVTFALSKSGAYPQCLQRRGGPRGVAHNPHSG